MAADRSLAETGIVEIKMGRSKFPGKPSKIGNRKRVNLSSCALPDDNESSRAAKNIYLGLSVFNETFGDNEMVLPSSFLGFSMTEVEEAMAEARLQQKEAEVEHKKQGININFWESFQSELFSIGNDSGNIFKKNPTMNNVKYSFDGGGYDKFENIIVHSSEKSISQPSKNCCRNLNLNKNNTLSVKKTIHTFKTPQKKRNKIVKFKSPKSNINILQNSSGLNKSLQSKAAKKLLEKAKMSNLVESNKVATLDKKFILPSHSLNSARVIKPNTRFLEENTGKRKLLRSHSSKGYLESDNKKQKVANTVDFFVKFDTKKIEKCKVDLKNEDIKKKVLKREVNTETNFMDNKEMLVSTKNNSHLFSSGKVILREARLQLGRSNLSVLEGPFSSPNSSGLSPNSQLKVNSALTTTPESIICGVCGAVRYYRCVEHAKKYGIYCCELCRKFISKILKSKDFEKELQCVKGTGLCKESFIVKNQEFSATRTYSAMKCQACWLKLCLTNFKMPIKLKQKLLKLLPVNMKISINLESNTILSHDITNKFSLGSSNIKDFKWLNGNNFIEMKPPMKDALSEKQLLWQGTKDSFSANEKQLRKRTKNLNDENKVKFSILNAKQKPDFEDKNRQSVILKGPRVKHVCRSASVVLGQPLATFPNENSPTKKIVNDANEDCSNCNSTGAASISVESQVTTDKTKKSSSDLEIKLGANEKKCASLKEVANLRIGTPGHAIVLGKTKKKANVKAENPISMDFWESYDPDEVCETGFGLIGSEFFSVRALCFLCGSSGIEKLIHCASCCEPYHEFCVDGGQLKLSDELWKYDWVCPRCTVCFTCERTSGQQLKCVKCDNSYHIECVDRVGGRLLHSPDRPWVCSNCLRCKSCNGIDVSVFVGNLPLCKACFLLRQKGNFCPLCQRCYEDDDYDSKMMECGQCKSWVHAKCEGLSDEKYQVLSFLPESVEYVCRMCCIMPPAPWWVAVEAELKSGYLGVLKALSKNRKVCTMLKWSPRKQCTCKNINFVSRVLDFEDTKTLRVTNDSAKVCNENVSYNNKEEYKTNDKSYCEKIKEGKCRPAGITERKTSIEVISHPNESLKLTLKIMKGINADNKEKVCDLNEVCKNVSQVRNHLNDTSSNRINGVRVKKCPSNEEISEDSRTDVLDCHEDDQTFLQFKFKEYRFSDSDTVDKVSNPLPMNPPSDPGIGSVDDELKTNCLTDEESGKIDDQKKNNQEAEIKSNCDTSVSFLEEKQECFCFLDVDSYNSRSKPFSPNLMSIKKKVTTSEYSSLHQFHQDMERMIGTTHSTELMDLYHLTIKEIFPWFDPKFSRVQSSSQKVSGTACMESTPIKNTPTKKAVTEQCKIPKNKLFGQPLDYFYNNYVVEDARVCSLCKVMGDGTPGDTGRLLYCGQNEWVHCNCALWSGEVFEEIDGSFQNVHSAISRGRSIRCPECNLKGASIGCCARNCQETYHFSCARKIGCAFMDDKTIYCPSHVKESLGKLVQNEKEFEILRPVYVELDKRKMKSADSSQIRFAVGALQVNNLGRFVNKLSDVAEAIIPDQFSCTRLFWSCYEPWKIVRYHFTVRFVEAEKNEGIDFGINLTIDHSKEPESVELKLKQLKHFQKHFRFLDVNEEAFENNLKERKKISSEAKFSGDNSKAKSEESFKVTPAKRFKKNQKVVKKIFEQFDMKDDENCLSDNQNTADLLPPDIEEAIFKDLPNDILDGISMQDIFMDIKNDPYENSSKDGVTEDHSENEDSSEISLSKLRKIESSTNFGAHNEFWVEANEPKHDATEDMFSETRSTRDFKKNKAEILTKKGTIFKTYQKSGNISWNCKTDSCGKWKKNSQCHVTVNFLEPQERGNMLQELKFTDGLVTISTGPIESVKELKACFEENKCSLQQEEGKENKCVSWQTRLQPRLLQVDGGVDSSSSGSEAGESPQRLVEESVNGKTVPPPQSSPFLDSPLYSLNSPMYSEPTSYLLSTDQQSLSFDSNYSMGSFQAGPLTNVPQVDGVEDCNTDSSDSEDNLVRQKGVKLSKFQSIKNVNNSQHFFRLSQCDGNVDSENEDLYSRDTLSEFTVSTPNMSKDEPVKCTKCHCTYRTKISYQRHLDSCCSDFILSSSEEEISEEESPKVSSSPSSPKISLAPKISNTVIEKKGTNLISSAIRQAPGATTPSALSSPEIADNFEVKKSVKRTYTRKKLAPNLKKISTVQTNTQPIQHQIFVPQPNGTPTLIVQDIPSNVIPTAFLDSTPTIGYVTSVDSPDAFGKSMIVAPTTGVIPGNFSGIISSGPEPPILGGLCLNSQNIQPNLSTGFIIQQPSTPGTLLSSQPRPVMVPNEQMMLGTTGLFDVVQDPSTGGMFLTNHNQPVFYNMETIVSNTVMQTNQFVSNVLATTYSQTSTQIFQTSEMEQVLNIPSNYIVVNPNTPGSERIISSEDLICVQTPQNLLQNQNIIQMPSHTLFSSSLQTPQPFPTDPKMMQTQINPMRCVQPMGPSFILNKITNSNTNILTQPIAQVYQKSEMSSITVQPNPSVKVKPVITSKPMIANSIRSVPMMRPNIVKSPAKGFEKAVITPKVKVPQPRSRALVDYINNFVSDIKEITPFNTPQIEKNKEFSQEPLNSISNQSTSLVKPTRTKISKADIIESSVEEKEVPLPIQSVPLVSSATSLKSSEILTKSVPKTPKLNQPSDKILLTSDIPDLTVGQQQRSNEVKLVLEKDISSKECMTNITETKIKLNESSKSLKPKETSINYVDEELKSCLSMPSLDDSSRVNCSEESKSFVESSLKDENLPLQENPQSINTGCLSKSPHKGSPNNNKQPLMNNEDKNRSKKKLMGGDQNSLDSSLVFVSTNSSKNNDFFCKLKLEKKKMSVVRKNEEKGPKLIFDVVSDDGFKSSSTSMAELWANICDSVQEMRAVLKIPPLPVSRKGFEVLGMQNHGLQHCLEQLRGVETCEKYKCKYFQKQENRKEEEEEVFGTKENESGCARTEKFFCRKEYDMFAWLASKHRQLPKLTESAEETLSSIRRANNLPMAMKYRNLKETAKLYVGVYRSKIHGRGLFCLREIEAGEMVIEYAGEVIRSTLTDKREKHYTDKGIGCYMFRIDDHFVVDATMKGNAARFINHSCEPNCYSRVVDILGKKHIVIFALRRINIMEELTYDYKFPFEDEKISCHCLSKKCRKYLN